MGILASRRRTRRAVAVVAVLAGALASLAALASCIVADPPPDLPALPRHHPIIVKGSVVPPYGKILPQIPSVFVVPVELIDPDTSFEYELFVDFEPTNPRQPPDYAPHTPETPTPADTDGGIHQVAFDFTSAVDPSTCHRLELIVALSFDRQFPHTPDAYGADSIIWIYSPTGEPDGCPRYDAGGADGTIPEPDGHFVPPTDAGAS